MGLRDDFPDLPPVWAAGVFVAQLAAAALPFGGLDPGWARPAGLVLLVAGIGLAGWAARWFARRRTPIEPGETPRVLIVEGPFRLNRNPIYTGMTVALAGAGLMLLSWPAAVLSLALPWILGRRFVAAEERRLREAFGAEAEAWLARSRRW
ncbi:isoprenylcysteine carboxylmethyltransferase family protein [Palleronia sediminis]|uniref:Isoprenylcysteine carboxylmethyltransferase family protein n=1 Tax=Palleronia sediminis TaxID=2547833 RepID=A0A4R6AE41_9RHOB|nr:isoprenylcysteine carboxylmethyltransferase family protein [Palleronia sediminis]TDL79726.1 isoprenylcysteine carboxylmethyltransferase family protein [Palleronia sediminis]